MTEWDQLSPQRQELLDLWLAEAGAGEAGEAAVRVPPATDGERLLAGIWREVLEVGEVGVDDDYFASGGDSITAIVFVAKAQQAGFTLSTDDLFTLRTIRRLAEAPLAAGAPPGRVEVPLPVGVPLTPMQQGMLFHALADPAGTAYVAQVSCRLDGDVDPVALAGACQVVVDRHPVLRATFRWDGPQPRQFVQPVAEVPVDVHDWRGDPPATRAARVADYLAADRALGFDLARPPLLRLAVLRTADDSCHVVLTHHHLLLDGWSQQLFVRELLAAYDGRTAGGQQTDRAFFGYLDWLAAGDLPAAERYWRDRLAGFTPTLVAGRRAAGTTGRRDTGTPNDRGIGMPADRGIGTPDDRGTGIGTPDGCGTGGRYATVVATVPAHTSAAVAAFARTAGLTVSTVLYGGWALVLDRLAPAGDVCFGVTVSGRPAELDGVTEALGMFINTLPLRVRLPAGEPLAQWLAELQARRWELDRFGYTPLTTVARCAPPRPRPELFDSIAVVENFPLLVGEGRGSGRLAISEVHAEIEEGYPLIFEAVPRDKIGLRLRFDSTVVEPDTAGELLAALVAYLEAVGDAPAPAELAVRLDEAAAGARNAANSRRRAAAVSRLLGTRRQPAAGPGEGGGHG